MLGEVSVVVPKKMTDTGQKQDDDDDDAHFQDNEQLVTTPFAVTGHRWGLLLDNILESVALCARILASYCARTCVEQHT